MSDPEKAPSASLPPYKDDEKSPSSTDSLPLPTATATPAASSQGQPHRYKKLIFYLGTLVGLWVWDGLRTDGAREAGLNVGADGLDGVEIEAYFKGLEGRGWKLGNEDASVEVEKLDEYWSAFEAATATSAGNDDDEADDFKNKHKKHDHDHKHKKHKKDHHKHKHGKHGKHGPGHGHGHGHPPHPPIGPKEAEELFLRVPNNESIAAASYRYTAYAHMAGTGFDLISALNLKAEYESLLGLPYSAPQEKIFPAGSVENQRAVRGLVERDEGDVWVDTYYPMMNKPVHRSLEILYPEGNGIVEWSAKLREDILPQDPTSLLRDEIPTFHGLSVSGNVTAKIIFAGYGTREDFIALAAAGFDLRKEPIIVLVKYGKVFRGLKVKAAQEAGAVGCLIYSDPGDDGEHTVKNGYKAYPEGPARQQSSVQRGSVQFLSLYPGDPSSPGYPAYENATRVPGGNFPSIPSLPISYEDALPLLKTLQGHGMYAKDVGADWEGGLGDEIEYWTGPGERDVRFVNEVDTKVTPIWSVFAYIPGHIKDEIVVVGNHRDAWVLGAADPSSGTASLYDIVRGFQTLTKKGWKPLRSILIASWDAEEYGLISSTEFAEDFGDFLQGNVVAYLNVDVSASGTNFHASASPSLANLVRGAADQINHPYDPSRSLFEMNDGGDWKTYNAEVKGLTVEDDFEAMFESPARVGALGSGSDYTAFLQRYGVASTDFGYGGGPKDAVYHYHSIYDSHTWQAMYGDVGFLKHTAAAKVLGLMTLRAVDSIILPINTTQYANEFTQYLAKIEAIAQKFEYDIKFTELAHSISKVQNASIALDVQAAKALDKLAKLVPPPPLPHKHGAEEHGILSRAISTLKTFFGLKPKHHKKHHDHDDHGDHHHHPRPPHGPPSRGPGPRPLPPKKAEEIKKVLIEIRSINKKLAGFEKGLLSKEGLAGREWYLHKGTAPGRWLGYGSTTFPGATEAMTIDKDPQRTQQEVDELAEMISAMAKRLSA